MMTNEVFDGIVNVLWRIGFRPYNYESNTTTVRECHFTVYSSPIRTSSHAAHHLHYSEDRLVEVAEIPRNYPILFLNCSGSRGEVDVLLAILIVDTKLDENHEGKVIPTAL